MKPLPVFEILWGPALDVFMNPYSEDVLFRSSTSAESFKSNWDVWTPAAPATVPDVQLGSLPLKWSSYVFSRKAQADVLITHPQDIPKGGHEDL